MKYGIVARILFAIVMMGSLSIAIASQGVKQVVLSEMQRRELAQAAAPIKSTSDLQVYFATTGNRATPFSRLSDSARHRFIESLTFNEKGLTGFSYADLQAELSATEIYQLLSLFGAQHLTSSIKGAAIRTPLDAAIMNAGSTISPSFENIDDHVGYYCSGRATCSQSATQICMSNC